jgi:hypothetical protein
LAERPLVLLGASLLALAAVVPSLAGCAGGQQRVSLEERSAASHRAEAARDWAMADEQRREYRPDAVARVPNDVGTGGRGELRLQPLTRSNPTERHLEKARSYSAHARAHLVAAARLEDFEATVCRGIAPAVRAGCPLLRGVTRVDDVPGGVRLTFGDPSRLDAVLAHMRCHLAYARVIGFTQPALCPLYVKGIDIRRAPTGDAIEIVATDAGDQATIDTVRRLSRKVVLPEPS